MAPRWEKDLHKAAMASPPDVAAFVSIGRSNPNARQPCMVLDAFMGALPAGDDARAREILDVLYTEGVDPTSDPFLSKYFTRMSAAVQITEQVSVLLPLDRDTLGLTLAELHQDAGGLDAAIDIVEGLTPTTVTAVSLSELYAQRERWSDVIELTNGVANEDEFSTYLLIQRGVAFRETGHYDASRESFKQALARRDRSAELRHLALVERGETYLLEGKKAMARKDFEKVLAENSAYPGLTQHLARIEG